MFLFRVGCFGAAWWVLMNYRTDFWATGLCLLLAGMAIKGPKP